MKLKTALTLSVTLILAVFVSLSAKLVSTADLLGTDARGLARAGDSVRAAEQLKNLLLVHNRNAFLYSLHSEPARLDRRNAEYAETVSRLETIDQLVDNAAEQAVVDDCKRKIEIYFQKRSRLEQSDAPPIEQYTEVTQDVEDAMAAIDDLVAVNHAQRLQLIADIGRRNRAADRAALVLLCIGSVMLCGLIFGVITMISRPLAALMRVISAHSAGESSARAEPMGLWETQTVATTFNLMADRLDEKRQDQLSFVASIAHDLRNPLHSVSMAAAMLLRKGNEKDQPFSEVILRQIKNIDRLVGDLLDTVRIESGQLTIQRCVRDIRILISDAVELHRSDSRLHDFKLNLPTQPLMCTCDGGRISQVMNNLISNAIKYSPSGGTISLDGWADERQVNISVTDQGIGISPDDVGNIFKPFNRTKETKNTIPGIGLGLAWRIGGKVRGLGRNLSLKIVASLC